MTPDPHPTLMERAEEMEAAAHKSYGVGDFPFAKKCSDFAHNLRMEAIQEQKNAAIDKL